MNSRENIKSQTAQMIELILSGDASVDAGVRHRIMTILNGHESPRRMLSTKEAAQILECHPITLRRLEKRGHIAAVRLSKRRVRWALEDVKKLASQGIE